MILFHFAKISAFLLAKLIKMCIFAHKNNTNKKWDK